METNKTNFVRKATEEKPAHYWTGRNYYNTQHIDSLNTYLSVL